jgi:hypothetical protein
MEGIFFGKDAYVLYMLFISHESQVGSTLRWVWNKMISVEIRNLWKIKCWNFYGYVEIKHENFKNPARHAHYTTN